MNKRALCPRCHRPQKVCLCHAISNVDHQIPIHVLMHPSEQGNAKGTAELLCRCLSNGQLWLGEEEADFSLLCTQLANSEQTPVLLYPDDSATAIEQLDTTQMGPLVVLDGTWRKTHKMLQLNPWLQQLPKVSFSAAPSGNYQIRKASRDDSLSTLEAVAYALEQLESCDTQPLYQAFEALKHAQLAFMPAHVRARYRD